jgi:hypothetical protein
MSLPLPPTNPNLTIPSRVGDNNRRLRRREGLTLPTPRTYRVEAYGSTPASTSSSVTFGSASFFLQPGEIYSVMAVVELACTAGNTCTGGISMTSPFGAASNALASLNALSGSSFVVRGSAADGAGTIGDNANPKWVHDRFGTPITVPAVQTINFMLARDFGTGPIQGKNLTVWITVL